MFLAGGAAACTASKSASPETSANWPAKAGGAVTETATLVWRLPAAETQVRPARPRPADWRSALTHSGSFSPASARRIASLLVEAVSLRRMIVWCPLLMNDRQRAAGINDAAAAVAASTSAPPINGKTKATMNKAANPITKSALPSTRSNGAAASSKNISLMMRK